MGVEVQYFCCFQNTYPFCCKFIVPGVHQIQAVAPLRHPPAQAHAGHRAGAGQGKPNQITVFSFVFTGLTKEVIFVNRILSKCICYSNVVARIRNFSRIYYLDKSLEQLSFISHENITQIPKRVNKSLRLCRYLTSQLTVVISIGMTGF